MLALIAQPEGPRGRLQHRALLVPYEQLDEAGFEDMARRAPDIAKIQGLIGYQPVLDLPEMLERVVAYEREQGR